MNYKVMNRPMFKMGGSTTPRKNYGYGSKDFNLFGDEGLISKRDALYKDLTDQLEKSKQGIAFQALGGIDFSAIDKLSDIPNAIGENKDRFIKGLMNQKSVDLKGKKMNLDKIGTDINLGLALRKQDSKSYEYKKRLADVDELQKTKDAYVQQQLSLNVKPEELRNDKYLLDIDKKIAFLLRETSLDEFLFESKLASERAGDDFNIKRSTKDFYDIKDRKYGRVERQMGSPMMGEQPMQEQPMQQETQMAGQPGQQEQTDPYKYLRQRLPAEIPDQVVKLIAYNQEAFADFASIETQDDLDLFNKRYNVELVVNV